MADLKSKKHLFFDLDDTLWDFTANSSAVLRLLFAEFGLEAKLQSSLSSFLEGYRRMNLGMWSRYYKREIDKQYMRNYRFHEVLKFFGYENYEESLLISQEYLKRAPFGTVLKEGCIETLTYLKHKYTLHIITNGFIESQAIKIDGCGLRPFFRNIIISEEYALIKPEEKIFRLAETLADAKSEECVMIGDSLESDVMGGLNAGWEAIYFSGEGPNTFTGTSVSKLTELMALF